MTRGKEAGIRGRSGSAGHKGSLSHGGSGLLGNETSLVTGQMSSQKTSMGGIEGVDKGVDTGAVSTIGDKAAGQGSGGSGVLGFEFGAVGVEGEVPVCGVVGVDEGVPVWVGFNFFVIVVPDDGSGQGSGSGSSLSDGSGGSDGSGLGNFRVEGSGFLTGGSDVVAFDDTETILASDIFDRNDLAVIADIRVLSYAVTFGVRFFFEDCTVFGGESGTGSAVTGVESLFFKDFSIFGIDVLRQSQSGHTSKDNLKIKRFER